MGGGPLQRELSWVGTSRVIALLSPRLHHPTLPTPCSRHHTARNVPSTRSPSSASPAQTLWAQRFVDAIRKGRARDVEAMLRAGAVKSTAGRPRQSPSCASTHKGAVETQYAGRLPQRWHTAQQEPVIFSVPCSNHAVAAGTSACYVAYCFPGLPVSSQLRLPCHDQSSVDVHAACMPCRPNPDPNLDPNVTRCG